MQTKRRSSKKDPIAQLLRDYKRGYLSEEKLVRAMHAIAQHHAGSNRVYILEIAAAIALAVTVIIFIVGDAIKANYQQVSTKTTQTSNSNAAPGSTETAKTAGNTKFSGTLIRPKARQTSGYGWRIHPVFGVGRMHEGIDFAFPYGSPILAAGAGKVIVAQPLGGCGNAIEVEHQPGFSTLYCHASSISVAVGQRVGQGQAIGAVGSTGNSTGPHLHLGVRKDGQLADPSPYLK